MPQDDVKRQDISKLPPATTIAWMQRTGYLTSEEGQTFCLLPCSLNILRGAAQNAPWGAA